MKSRSEHARLARLHRIELWDMYCTHHTNKHGGRHMYEIEGFLSEKGTFSVHIARV